MRPVAAVLLLSLLALAAGASAAEALSWGADASAPVGAVLIARKVCFFFPQSIAWVIKKRREREPETHLASLFLSLSLYSDRSQFVEPLPPVVGRNATVIVEVFNAGSR